jgi:5-methylcytosine-specific restriction protein A
LQPCAEHPPEARHRALDQVRGSFRDRDYDASWDRTSLRHREEEPLCRLCKAAGRRTAAQLVDHIVPKRAGGTDDGSNLQSLCRRCHDAKTRRDAATYPVGGQVSGTAGLRAAFASRAQRRDSSKKKCGCLDRSVSGPET